MRWCPGVSVASRACESQSPRHLYSAVHNRHYIRWLILVRLRAAAVLGVHLPAPGGQLDGFVHAWESHQLLREAEATGATAMPVVAAVARRATAPDAPAALEDLQLVQLLSNTTWPFCGTRLSTLDMEMSIMARA